MQREPRLYIGRGQSREFAREALRQRPAACHRFIGVTGQVGRFTDATAAGGIARLDQHRIECVNRPERQFVRGRQWHAQAIQGEGGYGHIKVTRAWGGSPYL